MKALKYVASLLPAFGRGDVLEDCDFTINEINTSTLPLYKTAVEVLRSVKFKSELVEHYDTTFRRAVRSPMGKNMFVVIEEGLPGVVHNLQDMAKLLRDTFAEDVAAGGLTYQKATILQFIELGGFVSRFARKLLNLALVEETKHLPDADTEGEGIPKAELDWINANFSAFCQAWNVVTRNGQQLKKQLGDIPEVVITAENAETLPHTVGIEKMDPLSLGLIASWFNPIYHVRLRIAEWQVERYKAAKEEKTMLELRLLNLKKLNEAKPDAKLQQQVAYMQGRVNDLNFKIKHMEEKYA